MTVSNTMRSKPIAVDVQILLSAVHDRLCILQPHLAHNAGEHMIDEINQLQALRDRLKEILKFNVQINI